MAYALVHILGSRSGYTTLDASGGVTASERSELEVLTFGGATSGDALGRLESSASMIGRKLQSGRFAVSRMFPGGIDDEGRPTIEVVSVLLDRAGYEAVVGALPRLANELRIWRGCRESVAGGYELPEQSCAFRPNDPGVIRAFDAWNAARERDGIALLTSADSVSLLAMVALLDPTDLIECRWGIGVLSLSAPVDLCILATSTSRVGPRLVIAPASAGIMLSTKMDSALWLIRQNSDESQLPAVNKLRAASAEPIDEPEHDGWRPPIAEPRALSPAKRKNLTPIAALSAAASMLLLVGMIVLYVRVGKMRTTVNGDGGSGAQSVEPFSPNPAPTPQPKSDVPIKQAKPLGSEETVPPVDLHDRAAGESGGGGAKATAAPPANSAPPSSSSVATKEAVTKVSDPAAKVPIAPTAGASGNEPKLNPTSTDEHATQTPATLGLVTIDSVSPDSERKDCIDTVEKARKDLVVLDDAKIIERIRTIAGNDRQSVDFLAQAELARSSHLAQLYNMLAKVIAIDYNLKKLGAQSVSSFGQNDAANALQGREHQAGFCKTFNVSGPLFPSKDGSSDNVRFKDLEPLQVPELCEAWQSVLNATEVERGRADKLWKAISESQHYDSNESQPKPPTKPDGKESEDAWLIVYGPRTILAKELKALEDYLLKKEAKAP